MEVGAFGLILLAIAGKWFMKWLLGGTEHVQYPTPKQHVKTNGGGQRHKGTPKTD